MYFDIRCFLVSVKLTTHQICLVNNLKQKINDLIL